MEQVFSEIEKGLASCFKLVLSSPKDKGGTERIVISKKKKSDGSNAFFAEEFKDSKAFHTPLSPEATLPFLKEKQEKHAFRQINVFFEDREISFRISKKGRIARSVNRKAKINTAVEGHNREKNYLIREGDPVGFMVDLGVFTKDYRIVSQKQDKFRQINRFIEILDHAFSDWDRDGISVLDFGCGKSYLTFFVYYYFSVLKKKRVRIIGYDLKEDVVAHCNALAKKYGYNGLSFVVADVTRDPLTDERIDFVISLHACDVATDYALNFALDRNVPYIFSVPCCQHEINKTIAKGDGDLDLFLGHGLLKERMSALLTDAIRARILEKEGYKVDVLEFVDFAHSPKNLMLRARKKEGKQKADLSELFDLENRYGFRQTLLHLREEKAP